jgi:ATP-dependent DNA helicase RecQ
MEHNYIFCMYCGQKNQPSYNFCTECGKSLKKKESKIDANRILTEKQPNKKFEKINRSSIEILNNVFGFNSFKGLQKKIIDHVNAGGDAIVLMPTGGGKSLCYQIPALFRDGLGLVISPLIALMRDQVESLKQSGVRAATINSSLSNTEIKDVEQQILKCSLDLLYVSPERMFAEGFLKDLKKVKLSLIAIDEAHCVSQWGHDFRPEYLKLNILKSHFPSVPILALTATADGPTRRDIIDQLKIKENNLFISSFDRPNIKYTVVPKEESKKN